MLKKLKNKVHLENIYTIFIYEKIIIINVWRKFIHLKRIELRIKSKVWNSQKNAENLL